MSNQNTGNHNLTIKLIQQNTYLENINISLLQALKSLQLIIRELALSDENFSQYIKSRQQEINLIFSSVNQIQADKTT
jgi:hypothetical protein